MSEWTKLIVVAVASVVTKELLTWLVSVIRKRKLKTTIRAKVNQWLAPYTSSIINNVFYIAISGFNLTVTVRNPEPLTRIAVAYIAFWVAYVLYWFMSLLDDIRKLRYYRAAQREAANESLAKQRPGREGDNSIAPRT